MPERVALVVNAAPLIGHDIAAGIQVARVEQLRSVEAREARHEHEWRVWERVKLPPGKILIPGVITHHVVTVEHPQVVADRIVRFARIVGRENVIAGSDCGFAQAETIARVHPKVMWAKFEALAAGARLATAELWGRAAA